MGSRILSLPPSGRAVLGADLNCSESRWGAADPPAVLHPIRCGRSPLHRGISVRPMSAGVQSRPVDSRPRSLDVCFASNCCGIDEARDLKPRANSALVRDSDLVGAPAD